MKKARGSKKIRNSHRVDSRVLLATVLFCSLLMLINVQDVLAGTVSGANVSYTTDADFDQGTLVNVNHDVVPDQLQLNEIVSTFPFINVAASNRGTILRIDVNTGMAEIHLLQIVGETLKADAILMGYIYRWREREGGDYAVENPASVAFDLHLIRSVDGRILWKSKYDKTQQSLTENLLDVGTFVKGGGKWMTVEKLAMIGLEKLVQEMPSGEAGQE